MIDQVLKFGPGGADSYYFQLIPLSLTLINKQSEVPAPGTTYRFSIQKGLQKFDQNRLPVEAAFTLSNGLQVLPISTCRLNFYIPSHNKQRKTEFALKVIQREHNVDYELGDYLIDVNAIIEQFKDKNLNLNRHEIKANFSEDYELDFEIYVDTNRVNLQKNIRQKKFDRASKSPLRTRKEGDEQTSARKNLVQETKPQPPPAEERPSRDFEEVQSPVDEKTTVVSPTFDPPSENIEKAESRHSNAKPVSVKRQPSAKNDKVETGSVQSKGHVPMVQTKFKQLSKLDTPAQVKMTDSQRLTQGVEVVEPVPASHGEQSKQEKIFLWVFLIIGSLLIYWAMHPTSRA